MKWTSKSELSTYDYKIELDVLLSPIYHLVLDLIREDYKDKQFYEWAGEVFRIKTINGKDGLDEGVSEDLFLMDISRFLEDYLYSKVDCLGKTEIKLIYRSQGLLIAPSSPKPTSSLTKWIKNAEVIEKFLELVNHSGIYSLKDALINLMNEQYFSQSVKATRNGPLKGTFIKKEMVEGFSIQPIDNEAIWLCDEWKKKSHVDVNTEFGEVRFPTIDDYSISIGEYILLLTDIDHFVKSEAMPDYFWDMLNNVFAYRSKNASVFREKCTEFAKDIKNSDFALLMKKLQYNLYIRKDSEGIPEKYQKYFEEVYNIEEFKEKTNQLLFTGNHVAEQIKNKQTMLGLYATQKEETEFNLRAWINVDSTEKQRITKGDGDSEVNIQTVYALRPQYSYYFCKDYFEDMFAEVLKDCDVVHLSNFELSRNDNPINCYIEIDNMVKKQDGTLVYIESKTTLNRYNIEETLNEVAKFHEVMINSYPNVHIEYLLVSPYLNETVEEGYSYFTNENGRSVTDFYIPIARFNGVNLHCVVEPEYDKLTEKMETLLK